MNVSNYNSNSFILSWLDYDSDFQSAFVEGYRVYLKSKDMQCHPKGRRTILPGDACPCSSRLIAESNDIDAELGPQLGKNTEKAPHVTEPG